MATQRTYQDLLAWYKDKNKVIMEYFAPQVKIYTLSYLPPYVRGATPVGLTSELVPGVYAWSFDFSTTAPAANVKNAFRRAMEKLNKADFATNYGTITHAFLMSIPTLTREGWPGSIYGIGGLFITSPLMPATGIQLGTTGLVLQQIAKALGEEIRTEGHLYYVDFTHPSMEYVMSRLDLAAEVITSEELMQAIPPISPKPTQPQAVSIPTKWLMWGGIGLAVLLLLVLLTRHGD